MSDKVTPEMVFAESGIKINERTNEITGTVNAFVDLFCSMGRRYNRVVVRYTEYGGVEINFSRFVPPLKEM